MTARPSTPSLGKQIAALYELGMVRCRMRDDVLTAGTVEWDHVHAWTLGGADDGSNLRPLCSPCHKRATAKLARDRAHIARLRGETCTAPRKKITSRGFDRTRRKKMTDDGGHTA